MFPPCTHERPLQEGMEASPSLSVVGMSRHTGASGPPRDPSYARLSYASVRTLGSWGNDEVLREGLREGWTPG